MSAQKYVVRICLKKGDILKIHLETERYHRHTIDLRREMKFLPYQPFIDLPTDPVVQYLERFHL